ncbi:MAG: ATP-binding cassette domain-containing protein [Solirubrobacteraceae bacterium]|nr:ATP-binding cassette domain-containing protein [Patulibacter sp.]
MAGLSVAYPDGAAVLDDVSLDIAAGEFVVVAGASGSGKSTLLSVLCGLVPHTTGGVVRGTARVADLDLRTNGPREVGKVVGYVGQEPERQVVMTTPRAELALGPDLAGHAPGAVQRAVEEVALALGIADHLDRDLATLSGGELQRVALGAALTRRPAVLVLDEPTSQLDPVAGDELLGLLRRLNQEWGVTVVLAEHRLERCLGAADRVVVLDRGRIAFRGSPSTFCRWAAGDGAAVVTSAATLLHSVDRALAGEAVTVKRARVALAGRGLLDGMAAIDHAGARERGAPGAPCEDGFVPIGSTASVPARRRALRRRAAARPAAATAVAVTNAWYELAAARSILRGLDLTIAPGEGVALMGRNGAGKTTLLRLLAGLDRPTRGRIDRSGRVALLMQRSADHLLRDRVADELPAHADLTDLGLDPGLAGRHPRDLSGGEQQLLAAAVVAGGDPPVVLCLDEPTRGLDRLHRARLAAQLARRRAAGTATIVATHDPEFAAMAGRRVILLGEGTVLADGPAEELLEGGWYFATEIARVLQTPGIITPADGAATLRARAVRPPAPAEPTPGDSR